MDIKHIQRSIIAGAIGECQYERVSFLQPKDFDPEYSAIWEMIAKAKGDYKQFYQIAISSGKKFDFNILLLSDYTHIEIMALVLLEHRFRAYLEKILIDYSLKSDKATEGLILAQTLEEVQSGSMDIFDLIDQTPEYLQPYVSRSVHGRLIELQKYVARRTSEIKAATK